MGQKNSKLNNNYSNTDVNKAHFKILNAIGKGGSGKIYLTIFKYNNNKFALKELSKIKIIKKSNFNSIFNEFNFLKKINSPYIINLFYAFQDRENLYMILDYLSGGDLRYHLNNKKIFNEENSKFLICCIILGLEVCHKNGYIHKDLKPENLVFDKYGYLKLTDFGISKMWKPENKDETSGTIGYIAPEVLFRKNHSYSVDFFALGVILHELILGNRPYIGINKNDIKNKIISKQVKIINNSKWSNEGIDFCNKLLKRNPIKRLGNLGIWELKHHQWLKNYNWNNHKNRNIIPNFIPKKNNNNYNYNYVNKLDNNYDYKDYKILKNENIQKYFKKFSFSIDDKDYKESNNIKTNSSN